MTLFADNCKTTEESKKTRQMRKRCRSMDRIWQWSCKWKMGYNVSKCGVLEFGRSVNRKSNGCKKGN